MKKALALIWLILSILFIIPICSIAIDENKEKIEYLISEEDKTISRIRPNTTIESFKKTFKEEIYIYSDKECKNEITEGLVGTGMYLKKSDLTLYSLIVIGDLNSDGNLNIVDLSKLINYLVGLEIGNLDEIGKKAADLNFDGIVNQIDLSRIIYYIVYGELNVPEITYDFLEMKINNEDGEKYINDTWTNKNVYIAINSKSLKEEAEISYEVTGANTIAPGETKSSILEKEGISKAILTKKYKSGEIQKDEYIIKIDKTAPKDPEVQLKLNNENGKDYIQDSWTDQDVYIKVSENIDDLSGILSTTYEVKGANQVSAGTVEPTILKNEGVSTLIVTTTDNAGNSVSKEYIIKINKTVAKDAELQMKLNDKNGDEYIENTWTNQDVYIEVLQDINSVTGKLSTTYEVKGANQIPAGTTEPTTLKNEGISTLVVTTVDNTGNSTSKNYTIKIDKTAPEAPSLIITDGIKNTIDNSWYISDVIIKIKEGASDGNGSGMGKMFYKVEGSMIIPEQEIQNSGTLSFVDDGIYIITAYNYDKAGNKSDEAVLELKIDKTTPADMQINVIDGILGSNDWYNTDVELEFVAGQDITSGVEKMSYSLEATVSKEGDVNGELVNVGEYKIEETEISDGARFKISTEGIYRITLYVYDKSGNKTQINKTIKIDKENDVTPKLEIRGILGNNEYYSSNVNVKVIYGEDITSGIERVTYQLLGANKNEETVINNNEIISIESDGITNIIVIAYDYSGNTTTVNAEVKKDSIAPINVDLTFSNIEGTSFTLNASAEDITSGIYSYEFYVDGKLYNTIISSENTVECDVTEQTSGLHTAYVIVKDNCGLETKSNIKEVETSHLTYQEIDYIEFIIDNFEVTDVNNQNQEVSSGASYLVSDTSLTENSKYIQVNSTVQGVKGKIIGHIRVIRTSGEIVDNLKYYPEDLVITMAHYSSGSGSAWTHLTKASLFETELYNGESPEETTRELAITSLNKNVNEFIIEEQKNTGVQTYTRVIISSIVSEGQLIPFRIVEEIN